MLFGPEQDGSMGPILPKAPSLVQEAGKELTAENDHEWGGEYVDTLERWKLLYIIWMKGRSSGVKRAVRATPGHTRRRGDKHRDQHC